VVTVDVVESWRSGLEDLFACFAGRFSRVEPRRYAQAYIRGLLAPLERKNGWTLAEVAGFRSPNGLQDFLQSPAWDPHLVRDDVCDYVVEHLGDPDGVLIADETGFLKKGVRSAGVQRQYSGTAGRTENCQIGTFLGYASSKGRALVDRELYLPVSWTEDRPRCRAAAIPDEVEFATKPQQARQMLERAIAAGVPFAWFSADEAYGQNPGLRTWLEEQDVAYVMATRCDQQVAAGLFTTGRVDQLIAAVRPGAWTRMSCGDGAHGPRRYDWARVAIRREFGPDRRGWVLARRSISDPTEIAYYVCYGRRGTRLRELVRVAGARWAVEESFQTAKNEVGLDQYQVRRYDAWYAHITLAMAAAAFLAATRAHEAAKGATVPRQTRSSNSAATRSAASTADLSS
jgi:SRSO17 transposase